MTWIDYDHRYVYHYIYLYIYPSTYPSIYLSNKTPAFVHCTACSDAIVSKYSSDGFQFIYDACRDPTILEEISGISRLMESIDDDLADVEGIDGDYDDF